LLAPADPADAMTGYYALEYDPGRVQLTTHFTPAGRADGFVAVCQTGRDLFVPLVVMRAPAQVAGDLLRQAMRPGRPYAVITTPELEQSVQQAMSLERQQLNCIYTLDPSAYRQVINVMVQPGETPYRYEIRTGGHVVAAAGVNWHTSRWADIYVYADAEYQGRGWGRAVAARCVQALLEARLLPLFTVAAGNVASQRLARALGFQDSGVREFECQGQLRV
jgi:GNAT superfamily N-acetyltransferase